MAYGICPGAGLWLSAARACTTHNCFIVNGRRLRLYPGHKICPGNPWKWHRVYGDLMLRGRPRLKLLWRTLGGPGRGVLGRRILRSGSWLVVSPLGKYVTEGSDILKLCVYARSGFIFQGIC